MKVLTFVIPAYNSAGFLNKCIPSMLVPEILDKLEIIVVNDGSTDETAATAESYCARYPQTVRLISQVNKGHGGALNTGCAAASGKYLKVIDADDWVASDNLPAFLQALEHCESDVVLTHYHTVDISTGEIQDQKCFPEAFGASCTLETVMSDWRSFYRCMTFHGITYRTAFYREQGICLSEHVFYEDYEYATFPCCRAKDLMALDLFVYEYRIGDVQQSVSDASKLRRIGHFETVLDHMIREYHNADLPHSAARRYAVTKIQELLLSYLTVTLLAEPDKKKGRLLARKQMEACREKAPEVYALAKRKYQVFCWMNTLHISKTAWERLLKTKFYNALRGNRNER